MTVRHATALWLSLPALVLLAVPFVTLTGVTHWQHLRLAWVRVMGEFGIVMIFAWFPHGMPAQLYNNLQNDGVDAVYVLLWLLLLFTLPVPLLCALTSRRALSGNTARH
ncbi:hypothetical protein E05_27730 [Plautia stali symbiont]|nr:hypothetical protein E05_27730 [Plautia stali symbiont]